eukprot:1150381-Pelagomonas_calceolata.AAC.1
MRIWRVARHAPGRLDFPSPALLRQDITRTTQCQWQHADLWKAVTFHTISLGVGGTCCTERTLNQFKQTV